MKALIVLKGHHIRFNSNRSFSYETSLKSINTCLINPISARFSSMSIMLNTYSSRYAADLLYSYSPKYSFFDDDDNNSTVLTSFCLLLNRLKQISLEDTFIIISRFDIVFRRPINFELFSTSKLNTLFMVKNMVNQMWIDDNLIGFPSTLLPIIDTLCISANTSYHQDDYHHKNLHWLFAELNTSRPPASSLNCISEAPMMSDSNYYFYLNRGRNAVHRLKFFCSRFIRFFRCIVF